MNAEHLQGQFCSPIITTGRTRLVLGRAGDRGPAPRIALASEEGVVKVVLTGSAPDEMAFYDALETNEASVRLLGDSELKAIARELTDYLRNNLKTDWSVRESVRAAMRVRVKRSDRPMGVAGPACGHASAGQAHPPKAQIPARHGTTGGGLGAEAG